jgi:hypothetical protein
VEQVKDNLAAVELKLAPEHIEQLDAVSAVPLGYPHDFVRVLFPQLLAE